MRSYCGLFALVLVAAAVLVPASSQGGCDGPVPSPTGWWEWIYTEYFLDPDPVYPGDGMTATNQIHCRMDGVMVTYVEEIYSSERPIEIACTEYDTGMHLFESWSLNGRMVEISGEQGTRIMTWTLPYYEGFRVHWAERGPIETVAAAPRSWGGIKGLYR